ncbi:hypothetical protein, partial [Paenibacillus sp. OV219]|uniref:hypothetical protein n=1 Tax=Paenibacillus sp. OV219 TaxID=1884377 RepID=UPI0008B8EAC9
MTITVTLHEGDQVIRKAQRDAYRKLQQSKQRRTKGGNFTFTDMERIAAVTSEIDATYLGYLMYLQTFIDYETNALVIGRGKWPLTRRDMVEGLGITLETFRTFYAVMERYSIIMEVDGRFIMNEDYHFRGAAEGRRVVKTYDDRLRKIYASLPTRKVRQLGYLYRLLPYIHLETNMLCWNPFETDPSEIRAMNKREIAVTLDIDEKTAYRLLQ